MSGINFRTSNFQVNTKLQRATVNNQKNEQEETKAAEKETKKPQVKLNIQTSGLNALGRYNMVSVNTTAKRATLKPASTNLKPASNSGDGKVNNELEKVFNSKDDLLAFGTYGDCAIVKCANGTYTAYWIPNADGIVSARPSEYGWHSGFGSEDEAKKYLEGENINTNN